MLKCTNRIATVDVCILYSSCHLVTRNISEHLSDLKCYINRWKLIGSVSNATLVYGPAFCGHVISKFVHPTLAPSVFVVAFVNYWKSGENLFYYWAINHRICSQPLLKTLSPAEAKVRMGTQYVKWNEQSHLAVGGHSTSWLTSLALSVLFKLVSGNGIVRF